MSIDSKQADHYAIRMKGLFVEWQFDSYSDAVEQLEWHRQSANPTTACRMFVVFADGTREEVEIA